MIIFLRFTYQNIITITFSIFCVAEYKISIMESCLFYYFLIRWEKQIQIL